QAEDGIRDRNVTGVQTCALPISSPPSTDEEPMHPFSRRGFLGAVTAAGIAALTGTTAAARPTTPADAAPHPGSAGPDTARPATRSEERRVGKGCSTGWWMSR